MAEAPLLVVHGAPASQPSRAVCWTCLIGGLPFELRPPAFEGGAGPVQALNPSGQIPVIEDGDFVLFEMPAILVYLCEKHGWALLPEDLTARARVHQYLHFHHNFTRRATMELMAPFVTVAFAERMRGTPIFERIHDAEKLERGQAALREIAALIEAAFFPAGDAYLCSARPTLADVACYEELGQLRWAGLFDFAEHPRLRAWLDAMETLPFHDEAHRYNLVLGDIRSEPNTLERFLAANEAGIEAVRAIATRGAPPR